MDEHTKHTEIDPRDIILLDLNYTLVANSEECRRFSFEGPEYRRFVQTAEAYRGDLVEAISNNTVVLITARSASLQDVTMRRIESTLGGWRPDLVAFRNRPCRAPEWKCAAMNEIVFPRFGRGARYLALESNAATRAMYKQLGIRALRYQWALGIWPEDVEPSDTRTLQRSLF